MEISKGRSCRKTDNWRRSGPATTMGKDTQTSGWAWVDVRRERVKSR